jgi:hypothetical protein
MDSREVRTDMSARGSPLMTMQSASLPGSSVPRRSPMPRASAVLRVAATMTSCGVKPQPTSSQSSCVSAPGLGAPSVPVAIVIRAGFDRVLDARLGVCVNVYSPTSHMCFSDQSL